MKRSEAPCENCYTNIFARSLLSCFVKNAHNLASPRLASPRSEQAIKKVKTPKIKAIVQLTVKSVYHELRVGITGDAQKVSMSQAKREAERRWKAEFVSQAVVDCTGIWKAAADQRTADAKKNSIESARERAEQEEVRGVEWRAKRRAKRGVIYVWVWNCEIMEINGIRVWGSLPLRRRTKKPSK